jgi:hypothetical protein
MHPTLISWIPPESPAIQKPTHCLIVSWRSWISLPALCWKLRCCQANTRYRGIAELECRIFYHDKCFDGACSASLFMRFHRECVKTADKFSFHGLVHRAGALFDETAFTGDENAIVDFKYSPSPRITWWFDHHQSAFLTPEDQKNFEQGQADGSQRMRKFYNPNYISCTSLIADKTQVNFGFNTAPMLDLIKWADIVDGARYESAKAAVEMAAPAMKLTMVIESADDPTLVQRLIPLLTEMSLQEVLDQDFVQKLLGPLMERHWAGLELIRERATVERGVITFDITDQPTEGYNKFIPYYLHPEATYNVGLSKSSFRTKVSVGTNPWTKLPPSQLVNLAVICERYGGGGHARVGAISFPPNREDEARKAVGEIVAELRAASPNP